MSQWRRNESQAVAADIYTFWGIHWCWNYPRATLFVYIASAILNAPVLNNNVIRDYHVCAHTWINWISRHSMHRDMYTYITQCPKEVSMQPVRCWNRCLQKTILHKPFDWLVSIIASFHDSHKASQTFANQSINQNQAREFPSANSDFFSKEVFEYQSWRLPILSQYENLQMLSTCDITRTCPNVHVHGGVSHQTTDTSQAS